MSAVQSEVQSDLISTYYDTPDLALNRKQLTLRVRKQGRKFVQAARAAEKNMQRIGHGQTMEALLAYLAGHRGRIVSYRQLGRFLGYKKMGQRERERRSLRTLVCRMKRLLARRKAPFAIAVAFDVGYGVCSILPDSK